MESARERRWQVIEAIGARNADKDPDDVERDIAEALAEARHEKLDADRSATDIATPRR